MRIYTVHIRRGGLDPDRDIVLVKEGFSWSAALCAPVWAMWQGMWVTAIVALLVFGGVFFVVASFGLSSSATMWLLAGVAGILGFLATDLRLSSLRRSGFVFHDVVAAPNSDGAAYRFFERNPVLADDIADTLGSSQS